MVTEQTTPATVMWARGLIIFNSLLALLIVALAVWFVDYHPTGGFFFGAREVLVAAYPNYSYRAAGYLSAIPLIQVLFGLLILWHLRKPGIGKPIVYVWFGIVFVLCLAGQRIPSLLLLIALVLLS